MPQPRSKRDQKRQAKKPRGQWVRGSVRASDLLNPGLPIVPGLVEALGKVMAGEVVPERKRVPARELVVRDEDFIPETLAAAEAMKATPPLQEGWIPVVPLSDGRYWAFDDAVKVRVWQETTPDLLVDVGIIEVDHHA